MQRFTLIVQMLTFFGIVLLLGCSGGAPVISALGELDSLQVTTTDFQSKNLASFNVNLSGVAPGQVTSLEVSTDEGRSWTDLDDLLGSGSVKFLTPNCKTNCPFTVTIPNLSTRLTDLQNMVSSEKRVILIRGQSAFGLTPSASFNITKLRAGFRIVSSWESAEAFRGNAKSPMTGYSFSSVLQEVESKSGSTLKGQGRVQ